LKYHVPTGRSDEGLANQIPLMPSQLYDRS